MTSGFRQTVDGIVCCGYIQGIRIDSAVNGLGIRDVCIRDCDGKRADIQRIRHQGITLRRPRLGYTVDGAAVRAQAGENCLAVGTGNELAVCQTEAGAAAECDGISGCAACDRRPGFPVILRILQQEQGIAQGLTLVILLQYLQGAFAAAVFVRLHNGRLGFRDRKGIFAFIQDKAFGGGKLLIVIPAAVRNALKEEFTGVVRIAFTELRAVLTEEPVARASERRILTGCLLDAD